MFYFQGASIKIFKRNLIKFAAKNYLLKLVWSIKLILSLDCSNNFFSIDLYENYLLHYTSQALFSYRYLLGLILVLQLIIHPLAF